MTNFKQFKLTNGDEVIADVVDGTDSEHLVIRAAMKIVEVEHLEEGYSYFAFRPFISFADSPETLQILANGHIIAENVPSTHIMKHYARSISMMSRVLKVGKTLEELESMTGDQIHDWVEEYIKAEKQERESQSQDLGENVIRIDFDKDKLH